VKVQIISLASSYPAGPIFKGIFSLKSNFKNLPLF